MPALALPPLAVQAIALVTAVAAVALAAVFGYRAWKRSRIAPEERERRRRVALAAHGKLTDATLVEIREDVLFYSYLVRGVEYVASQDVAGLKARMPGSLGLGVSSVTVKYDSQNPANSIVLAEEWSGLHGVKAG